MSRAARRSRSGAHRCQGFVPSARPPHFRAATTNCRQSVKYIRTPPFLQSHEPLQRENFARKEDRSFGRSDQRRCPMIAVPALSTRGRCFLPFCSTSRYPTIVKWGGIPGIPERSLPVARPPDRCSARRFRPARRPPVRPGLPPAATGLADPGGGCPPAPAQNPPLPRERESRQRAGGRISSALATRKIRQAASGNTTDP